MRPLKTRAEANIAELCPKTSAETRDIQNLVTCKNLAFQKLEKNLYFNTVVKHFGVFFLSGQ